MFAKFVNYTEGNGVLSPKGFRPTVPKVNSVYEASEVIYGKKCFRNFEEYMKWMEDSGDSPAETIGFPLVKDDLFEVVATRIYNEKNGETTVRVVHAIGCEFYLLNDEGKTIDRVWCANGEEQKKMLKEHINE